MPSTPAVEAANLAAVFKAYDVRGTVPDQIDEELARRVGSAFVQVTDSPAVVVGHDMRPSSPGLAGAFAEGAAAAGADVTMIGLASTDQLYFASGFLGQAGAMFTASHNPAAYNGIKLCRSYARPVGLDTGLAEIRDLVEGAMDRRAAQPGAIVEQDVLEAYAAHLVGLAPVTGRRLKVVVDAGNAMAGLTAPAVLGRVGDVVAVVPLYFELDGTFPNHDANPLDESTLVDLQARVVAEGADVGLAFDGDADRCFLVDETGAVVSPSAVTALIATRELVKEPGATIIHNLITSRSVPEIVREHGGTPVRTKVGHSGIKARMAETNAIFGGEHSGHFYFRDFWRADSGMLAALHVLAALAETRPAAVGAHGRLRPLRRQRRDQQRGRRHRRRPGAHPVALRGPRGRRARRAGRPERHARRLGLQRARVEHRAPAPAQRRGHRPCHHGTHPRRAAQADQE